MEWEENKPGEKGLKNGKGKVRQRKIGKYFSNI